MSRAQPRVAGMPNPLLARFSFVHRDVFPSDDRMARYVERLSVALGDLRIAGHYATRSRQNSAERLYFVRLTASHLREIVLLFDPPDRTVIPDVEEFLASLPRGAQPSRAEIRKSHRRALRLLDKPMAKGRADVVRPDGRSRRRTLRDDLRDLRNGFFHYGYTKSGDEALAAAMNAVSGKRTAYVVRERTMRAEYADLLGANLAHPFDLPFVHDLHTRIVELIGPIASFVQQVEAAWLYSRPEAITLRRPGRDPEPLRAALR